MAVNKASVFASYDVQSQVFNMVAWLEVDGELDTGATDCRVKLYPQATPTVAVPEIDVLIPTPHTPGQFTLQVSSLALVVGAPYFAAVSIKDTGTALRTSGAAVAIL